MEAYVHTVWTRKVDATYFKVRVVAGSLSQAIVVAVGVALPATFDAQSAHRYRLFLPALATDLVDKPAGTVE